MAAIGVPSTTEPLVVPAPAPAEQPVKEPSPVVEPDKVPA